MNTTKDTNVSDSPQLVNEQRRRLAKGGLAAPVVIGALLSRPVLGAAPHKCTISGQLSGNVSTHATTVQCSSLGQTVGYWRDLKQWPLTVTASVQKTTPFTAVGFTDTYWKKTKNPDKDTLVPPTTTDAAVATFQEVLENNPHPTNPPTNLDLGREAVAAYLNAIEFAPNYPLSRADVVAMFNAVIVAGGRYDPLGVNWDATQVLAYFRSLHP